MALAALTPTNKYPSFAYALMLPNSARDSLLKGYVAGGILTDKKVFQAMQKVDRALFVSDEQKPLAWADWPLPIGYGQTISAPHMYAYMLSSARISTGMKVLEIGTGSGYGAALLAELVGKKGKVFSVEIVPELVKTAIKNIRDGGYGARVSVMVGNGYLGHSSAAPYERILVTAAVPYIPQALLDQLSEDGIMLIPVGGYSQILLRVEKKGGKIIETPLWEVAFVPLIDPK